MQNNRENPEEGWEVVSYNKKKYNKTNKEKNTIFVNKIPHSAVSQDLWSYFNKEGTVKDTLLPRRRDKFGKKVGFVKTKHQEEEILENKDLKLTRQGR